MTSVRENTTDPPVPMFMFLSDHINGLEAAGPNPISPNPPRNQGLSTLVGLGDKHRPTYVGTAPKPPRFPARLPRPGGRTPQIPQMDSMWAGRSAGSLRPHSSRMWGATSKWSASRRTHGRVLQRGESLRRQGQRSRERVECRRIALRLRHIANSFVIVVRGCQLLSSLNRRKWKLCDHFSRRTKKSGPALLRGGDRDRNRGTRRTSSPCRNHDYGWSPKDEDQPSKIGPSPGQS